MKVLIVSDTHRYGSNYYEALERALPVDLVIHCGDVEGQEEEFEEVTRRMADCPIVMVAGNNDFFSGLNQEKELKLEGCKILVTHGHHYYVSMNNEFLKQEAAARGYDIVMYGHTHRPVIDRNEKIIAINPGSLTYPRQEGRLPSYVLMEIDNKKEVSFELFYLK